MAYRLGIDVGSAYTSAAVFSGGRLETLALGGQDARIPTVLFVRPDGAILVGRAALRRALSEPGRAARDFLRRLGDPSPVLVGGAPYAAQALVSRLLGWVVEVAVTRYGETPQTITVTHPASWSPYKADLLLGALRQADVAGDPHLGVRPAAVAAAAYHSHRTGASPDELVAVYDLGAGTFDAAVVGGVNPQVLGSAAGLEHFGGFDLDEALGVHALEAAGAPPTEPFGAGTTGLTALSDPDRAAARARLRAECAEAKELLSEDDEAEITVQVNGGPSRVTVTRGEFEALARPPLTETVRALRRALGSVPVETSDLSAVLLLGGCSRIPLVRRLLVEELGPQVALDLRPPEDTALGAALLATGMPLTAGGPIREETVVIGPPMATSLPPSDPPRPAPSPAPAPASVAAGSAAAPAAPAAPADQADQAVPVGTGSGAGSGSGVPGSQRRPRSGGRRWVPIGIAAGLVPLVAAGVALFLLLRPHDDDGYKTGSRPWAKEVEAAENLPSRPVTRPTASSANQVLAAGSVEVAPITETAYALFRAKDDNVSVTVDAIDTEDGLTKLCQGKVDIAGASFERTATPDCSDQRVVGFEVAHETLPVVVDPSNTWARCLTLSQLHQVFGRDSKVTNWRQLDPTYPDVPLSIYGPDQSSVPYAFFNASVNGGREAGRTDYRGFGDGNATARGVSATRGAIGYLDFPSLAANGDRVRPIEINSGSGCVPATLPNAQNGRYLPLCKPLFLYVRKDSLRKPAVAAFVRFYLTNGERIATDAHYVPRAQQEISESVAKINDLTKGVGPVVG